MRKKVFKLLARPEVLTAVVLAVALVPRMIGVLGDVEFEELPFT